MDDVDYSTEIWKAIPSFPDYEASSLGRVRCADRFIRRLNKFGVPVDALHRGRVMAQRVKDTGYCTVTLRQDKDMWKTRMVSRLVCEAFHGPAPDEAMDAAHNNGIRNDNRPENLRWATKRENCADMVEHGTLRIGSKNSNSILTADEIPAIRALADGGMTLREIGIRYGVSKGCIQHAVTGLNWKHVER